MYKKTSSFDAVIAVIGLIIIAVGLFVSCGRSIQKGTNFRQEIGTVTDKGVKRYDDEDKYLVYTKNQNGEINVYEVTDSFIAGRFDSSDVYAGIEIGKTYEFTVAGERSSFFSWYPNIYEYKEIEQEEQADE